METKEVMKAYAYGILILFGALGLAALLSLMSYTITDELAISILQNTIQLDGLLFGFSAVMFGLIFTRERTKIPKENEFYIAVVSFASFFCYSVSLGVAFTTLTKKNVGHWVLYPAYIAILGVMISAIYMVTFLLVKPSSTKTTSSS
jgi:hypothetical protein